MPSVNEILLDRIISHAVYVERWKEREIREMLKFMNDEVFPDITRIVETRLDSLGVREATRLRRLQEMSVAIQDEWQSSTQPIRQSMRAGMLDFAAYESQWMAQTVQSVLPVQVTLDVPTPGQLRAILSPNAVEGDILGKGWQRWWGGLQRNTTDRIMQQVRVGFAEGQSTPDIVRRLRGTRSNGFSDGVYQASRREATMIVRTAATDTSARARQMTIEQNEDMVKGVQYVATLDSRTTPICRTLDGRVFKVGDGPRPPQHPNCRSTVVPVLKSFEELGIPGLKELPPETRASVDGQVAKTTYGEWLKRQPKERQDDILGSARADMFRAGKVHIDRFNDASGKLYTLDQLRAMDDAVLKDPRYYTGERRDLTRQAR